MQKVTTILLLGTTMMLLTACSAPNITNDQAMAANTTAKARTSSTDPSAAEDRRMVFLGGKALADTGRTAFLTTTESDGEIASETGDLQSTPDAEAEANFDCIGAPYLSLADGAAAVLTDGEYQLFLADDMVEYEGVYKKKKDVSEDTLKWLDFYYGLSEKDRTALSMVPREFSEAADNIGIAAAALETTGETVSYIQALTEDELTATEALAQTYFTDDVPVFEGVDQIYPVDNDASLYTNSGLEGEYPPGSIIIYKVLTVKDRRDGNPFRFISIARRTKSDSWKIINCGY